MCDEDNALTPVSVQLTMMLERTPASWSEETLGLWYNVLHDREKTEVNETDGSRVSFQSRASVLARAHLTQGCKVGFHMI